MRREGFWKVIVARSGGGGRLGVSGTGRGFEAGACLRRSCNLGICSRRSGMPAAGGLTCDLLLSVVEGILFS